MKKFVCIVTLLLSAISLSAQNHTREGIVGLNVSNCGNFDSKTGFHVGARVAYDLPNAADGVYANAALLFTLKGFKIDWGIISDKTNAFFAEIPVHIGYKHYVNYDFAVFGEVGPYVGLGLFGKSKSDSSYYEEDDDYYDVEIEETSNKTFDLLKRFDLGAGLRVGIELNNKYSVSLGYDWGFIDSYKDSDTDEYEDDNFIDLTPSMKHSNLSVSISWKF